jgi:hypothetical protein
MRTGHNRLYRFHGNMGGESIPNFLCHGNTDVIRINRRPSTSPGSPSRGVTIVQSGNSTFIELTLGEGYLLLLNPAPMSRILKIPEPVYIFADEAGFRMDARGRLVPLVAGGELEAYRGRLLREVVAEIQRRPKSPGGV